jgi:hypothetical protein
MSSMLIGRGNGGIGPGDNLWRSVYGENLERMFDDMTDLSFTGDESLALVGVAATALWLCCDLSTEG